MSTDQLMEPGNPLDPFRQSGLHQSHTVLVGQMDVVMGLGPVHSYKDHSVATFQLVGSTPAVSLEVASSPLMDQCSRHDIPPAITATSPTSRGTI